MRATLGKNCTKLLNTRVIPIFEHSNWLHVLQAIVQIRNTVVSGLASIHTTRPHMCELKASRKMEAISIIDKSVAENAALPCSAA